MVFIVICVLMTLCEEKKFGFRIEGYLIYARMDTEGMVMKITDSMHR